MEELQQVEVSEDSGLTSEADHEEGGHGELEDQDGSDRLSGEVLSSVNDAPIPALLGNGRTINAMLADFCTLVTRVQQDLAAEMEYAAKHQASQESAVNYWVSMRELKRGAGTISELQKPRLEDEQKRLAIEKAFTRFGMRWDSKLAVLAKEVDALEEKFAFLERAVENVKKLASSWK